MSTITLTDEMVDLLREGAKTAYGRCCYPVEARKNGRTVQALYDAGLAYRGDNGETPLITDAGRAAVGGPSREEMQSRELGAYSAAARAAAPVTPSQRAVALKHSTRKNERVAFLLVVHDEADNWMRVSVDGNPAKAPPFFTKSRFGEPELVVTIRSGRFAVGHLAGGIVIERGFTQRNVPLLFKGADWTKEEVGAWRSLRLEMLALRNELEKQRRRAKGHRPEPTKYRFGESA